MKQLVLRSLLSVGAALCAFTVHAQEAQKAAPAAAPEPAPAPAPAPGQEPDPKIIEDLFACIAEGLPQDWKKTWFVISEIERKFGGSSRKYEAKFFFATDMSDRTGRPLQPCGADRVRDGVLALNDYLPENQQRWTGATFTFTRDGKYEVKYDFAPPKPAPAKRRPAPASRKPEAGSKPQ